MYCNKVEIISMVRSVPKFLVDKVYNVRTVNGKGYIEDEYGGLVLVKELHLAEVKLKICEK